VHELVAALAHFKTQPHDRIAMNASHPLNAADAVAFDKGGNYLGAAFDGEAVDHG